MVSLFHGNAPDHRSYLSLNSKDILSRHVILAGTMLDAMGAWVFFLGNPVLAIVPGGILLGLLAVGGSDVMDLIASIKKIV